MNKVKRIYDNKIFIRTQKELRLSKILTQKVVKIYRKISFFAMSKFISSMLNFCSRIYDTKPLEKRLWSEQ